MSIGVRAAAEGRSEMAFWPAVATAYLYVDTGGWVTLLLLGVFSIAGALTYIFLRSVEAVVDAGKQISQTKSRNSRDGTTAEGVERIKATYNEFRRLFPENRNASKIVSAGILLDVFGGLYLLLEIGGRIADYSNPTVAGVILFLLPILNLLVIASAVIWNL